MNNIHVFAFILPTIAPVIRATVIAANVAWNTTNNNSGMVVSGCIMSIGIPCNRKFAGIPINPPMVLPNVN